MNGIQVATYLQKHPKIEKVIHPMLENHDGHEVHKRQARGFTGIVTAYVKGDYEQTKQFLQNLRLFKWTTSLGGIESTIDQYSDTMKIYFTKQVREKFGYTDNLLRISVGIENI